MSIGINLKYSEYLVNFIDKDIKATVTSTPSIVEDWISTVQNERRYSDKLIVGLDIESQLIFLPHKVATLQLCVGRRCLIFQIFHAPYIPQSLINFLINRDYIFVGVGIESAKQDLLEEYDLRVGRVVDLMVCSTRTRGSIGFTSLASEILGVDIKRPSDATLSDWEAECLTTAQVQHACEDVVVSYEIGRACEARIRSIIRSTNYVNFLGNVIKTTVTNEPKIVDDWISNVLNLNSNSLHVVGLDVEWRPTVNRHHNRNRVATLQLCVEEHCLIFQIFHAPYIPQSLIDFLKNELYTFVGVGIEADKQKLLEDYDLRIKRCVDLTVYSTRRNIGLKNLASEILGVNFDKPLDVTLSDWQAEYLTPAQVQYACIDASVSYDIGMACKVGIRGIIY